MMVLFLRNDRIVTFQCFATRRKSLESLRKSRQHTSKPIRSTVSAGKPPPDSGDLGYNVSAPLYWPMVVSGFSFVTVATIATINR